MKRILIFIGLLSLVLNFGCVSNTKDLRSNDTTQIINLSNNATAPAPTECYGPVCGSDNREYATNCDAINAGVGIGINGTCLNQNATCVDGDSGLDTTIASNTSKGNITRLDHCVGQNNVVEYGCINNNIVNATLACATGTVCQNGACVNQPPTQNQTITQVGCFGPSSIDVENYNETRYNGVVYKNTCADYRTVKDFYCKNGAIQNQNEVCPAGQRCQNGSCVETAGVCQDSDGGVVPLVKGKVRVSKIFYNSGDIYDECIDTTTLKEMYCLENGNYASVNVTCGNGQKCDDGKCTSSACTDSDGGRDYFHKGTVTSNDVNRTDECVTSKVLKEYYCEGDQFGQDEHECDGGYVCSDGQCVPRE